jgi:hypothetical protein
MRTAVLSLTLLLAACAGTPEILVSQPGATTPAQLQTYEFRSSEAVVDAGARARQSDARLAEVAERKLVEKGYTRAAAGAAPDFILTYRVAVFTSENPRDAYAYVRDPTTLTGRDLAPDPAGSEGLVREATLVLMALSVPGEKVIWQATASGVAVGRQELTTGALRAAGAMLDRFPKRQP